MEGRQAAEAVIELASLIKAQVTSLRDEYARLPGLIDKEHRAIRAHDLAAVQGVGAQKQLLSDQAEACFQTLVKASAEVGRWLERLGGPTMTVTTLSETLEALTNIAEKIGLESLAAKVLRHQIDGLAAVVGDLTDLRVKTKTLLEQNKLLLESMLVNYQESYRFWVSLCEETAASYNSQGQQKAAGRLSGFQARA